MGLETQHDCHCHCQNCIVLLMGSLKPGGLVDESRRHQGPGSKKADELGLWEGCSRGNLGKTGNSGKNIGG